MADVPRSVARTYHHATFDVAGLRAMKRGRTVSVCLPARNEAATVGDIVRTIRTELVDGAGLVDEILVLDDGSTDATADVALDAGARVESTAKLLPECGPGTGKGEALWKSVFAAEGDLIVWCDADITDFDARFVVGLLGPLLTRPEVGFVKGFYDRPVDGTPGTGGRVTELVARPLISLLLPPARPAIVQPLSGEYAGRREVLEEVPFVQGYGVDLGLLVDVSARFGLDADRPGRPRHARAPQPPARRAVAAGAGGHADGVHQGQPRAGERPRRHLGATGPARHHDRARGAAEAHPPGGLPPPAGLTEPSPHSARSSTGGRQQGGPTMPADAGGRAD